MDPKPAAVGADEDPDLGLRELTARTDAFRAERRWEAHHTPRNLLLAMVGETGELAELFQWRGDRDCGVGLPSWTQPERQALSDELADVLLYLVQLSAACGVDLVSAAQRKMALNALKYPVDGSGKATASKEDHRRAVELLNLQTQPKQ